MITAKGVNAIKRFWLLLVSGRRPSRGGWLLLIALSVSALMIRSLPGYAHHDDGPSPPRLQVNVQALEALFGEPNQDDGADVNAELLVEGSINHHGHRQLPWQTEVDDLLFGYNYDATGPVSDHHATWQILRDIMRREGDCTPRNTVTVEGSLAEIDVDGFTNTMEAVGSGLLGLALTKNPLVSFFVGIATSLTLDANGNDDLGRFSVTVEPNTDTVVSTTGGADGSATFTFRDVTDLASAYGMCYEERPLATSEQDDRPMGGSALRPLTYYGTSTQPDSSPIFSPLKEAVRLGPRVKAEAGIPLTEQQVDDIRRTLLSAVLGLTEQVASEAIEAVAFFHGVDLAIADFQAAQQRAAASPEDAVSLYQSAYDKAVAAEEKGVVLFAPVRLPFQIAMAPDFFATKPGRSPEILASVLGSGTTASLRILESYPGISVTMSSFAPGLPHYSIEAEIAHDVAPGSYPFTLSASEASAQKTRSFTLVVNPLERPSTTGPVDGVVLTSLGTTLSWENPHNTTQYNLEMFPVNGDGPGINLIRNAEESYTIQPPVFGQGNYVMLPDMKYWWRVRTTDKKGFAPLDDPSWSKWSTFRSFHTPRPSSAEINPVFPTDGDSNLPVGPVTLQWQNTETSIYYYEVQASTDPNFGELGAVAAVWHNLVHGGASNPLNSWTTPRLETGTSGYWRIRPRVQGTGTPVAWSPTWSFTTHK